MPSSTLAPQIDDNELQALAPLLLQLLQRGSFGDGSHAAAPCPPTGSSSSSRTAGASSWAPPLFCDPDHQQLHQHQHHQQQHLQVFPQHEPVLLSCRPRGTMPPTGQVGSIGRHAPLRRVPTMAAHGTSGSSSSSSSSSSSRSAGSRVPLDIMLRAAAGGGGIAAGIGGGAACGPCNALQLRLWPLPGFSRGGAGRRRQSTVLIMMSNTGGGHKASAEALKQAFEELHHDKYRVLIVDMWEEHTPFPFNQLPNSYSFMVKHGFLWRAAYHGLNPPALHLPYMATIHAFTASHLHAAFDTYDPDLVVSVHPLMQHIPARVLAARAKRLGRAAPVPLATVVTDFTTCHNTWFHKAVNKCFVPTEFCRQLGFKMGLQPSQLVVHGLPIRPIFSKRLPGKAALRRKLGLLPGVPAILLVGGGEGMGKLRDTVTQLDTRLQGSAQVAVICGRNKKLLNELRGAAWPGGSHVVACGFVDNIHEWMAAVDTIITKAGPGTIAEALISGLPILLNGNVPCQEEGNIPYVVDNGVGAFETNPARIADIIADWLAPSNAAAFKRMAARSKALGRPHAVYDIVHDLAELAAHAGAEARKLLPRGRNQQPALPVGQLVAA